jgi:hypothetical protein
MSPIIFPVTFFESMMKVLNKETSLIYEQGAIFIAPSSFLLFSSYFSGVLNHLFGVLFYKHIKRNSKLKPKTTGVYPHRIFLMFNGLRFYGGFLIFINCYRTALGQGISL